VQFRDSKLTHLLKGALTGTGLVVMVAHVNPCHGFYEVQCHQERRGFDHARPCAV
jgi:hypothetical protein